ncbi:MAG TPA: hypothetical protein VK403_00020 [Allosphingosinicella sp.]|nr:hypothetical protein [Allosphingosinicella sp.]
MAIRLIANVLLAAAAICATAPALAGEKLKTDWIVQPIQTPDAPVRASPGDEILRQRVLPRGVAVLRDLYTESGARWTVQPGTELFEAQGSAAAIYCPLDNRPPSSLVKILSVSPSNDHLCFIDRDRDGCFEMSFRTVNSYSDLPGVFGSIMPSDKRITPLRYEVVDPTSLSRETTVTLRYARRKGNRLEFTVAYGWPERLTAVPGPRVSIKTLPARFELLGGRFVVTEVNGNDIVVEVDRTMPEGPIGK